MYDLRIVLAINLCITSQASLSLQAQCELWHFLTVLSCNLRALRTGADDAQVTLQDIYKLRQFINAASTNDFANGRDAVIVFAAGKTGDAVLFGIDPHASEFENTEFFAILR